MSRRLGGGMDDLFALAVAASMMSAVKLSRKSASTKTKEAKPPTEREHWNAEVEARKVAKKERKP